MNPIQSRSTHAAFGQCATCNTEHRLGVGNANQYALELMKELDMDGRIDYLAADADSRFSTDYLFGVARGQMFGILECQNLNGDTVVLRAFSCKYNGVWDVEGWVPPLFDAETHDQVMDEGDLDIKSLGRQLEALSVGDPLHAIIREKRRQASRSTMRALHELYELRNFRGEVAPLTEFFKEMKGVPSGAGDCCAPKLLHHAAQHNLRPVGITEFYWGKTNRSETRVHGQFYSSCVDKCQPILGFMLCGAG